MNAGGGGVCVCVQTRIPQPVTHNHKSHDGEATFPFVLFHVVLLRQHLIIARHDFRLIIRARTECNRVEQASTEALFYTAFVALRLV